jgi:COMPASS component BRE2
LKNVATRPLPDAIFTTYENPVRSSFFFFFLGNLPLIYLITVMDYYFQRIRPRPFQPQDLVIVPRTSTTHLANIVPPHGSAASELPNTEKHEHGSDDDNDRVGSLHERDALYYTDDHPHNRRGFRYLHAVASPTLFPVLTYTLAESAPYHGKVSYFDRAITTAVDAQGDCMTVATQRGFVSARADLCIREGGWYYETRVLRANDESGAHVRLGITRREASLEAPVGFDVYGYGLRDKGGQAMHLSRPRPFVLTSAEAPAFQTGDVIGLHVQLPSRVIDPTRPVFRDRIAIKYKGMLYFECLEYQPTKEMEDLIVPLKKRKIEVEPEVIPGSFIDVYKNGKYVGRAFSDLSAFLPPNSKLHQVTRERRDDSAGHDEDENSTATNNNNNNSNSGSSSRTKTNNNNSKVSPDDGQLGYFPTVSVFNGGCARFNFGPHFDFPPENLAISAKVDAPVRPLCERYDEQIAEDILQDILDEIYFEGEED